MLGSNHDIANHSHWYILRIHSENQFYNTMIEALGVQPISSDRFIR